MVRSLEELEAGGHAPAYKEVKHLLDDQKTLVDYCISKGIFDCPNTCGRCSAPVKLECDRCTVRCRKVDCQCTCPKECERCGAEEPLQVTMGTDGHPSKANCTVCKWEWRQGLGYERSVFRGSFCQQAKLPKNEIFHCMWLWLHKVPCETAANMLLWNEHLAGKWYRFFRQMVAQMIDNQEVGEGMQLGGIDPDAGNPIIVEIDESKFGKRKYNRGRRVTANWVIGMVEKTK